MFESLRKTKRIEPNIAHVSVEILGFEEEWDRGGHFLRFGNIGKRFVSRRKAVIRWREERNEKCVCVPRIA
jgi:hypothetical protein